VDVVGVVIFQVGPLLDRPDAVAGAFEQEPSEPSKPHGGPLVRVRSAAAERLRRLREGERPRGSVPSILPSRTRLTVSITRSTGTTPSQPWSAASARVNSAGDASGRAAS
jgi:hypothetical protein